MESVTHGHSDSKPTVTFPAVERHGPLTGTKLWSLVTGANTCKQLVQSCYVAAPRPGVETVTP